MKRHAGWGLVALILVLVLGSVSWRQAHHPLPQPPGPVSELPEVAEHSANLGPDGNTAAEDPAAQATVPAPDRRFRRDVAASPSSVWLPLPATDLPLHTVYPQLRERADRGDAPAACRLAAELSRCSFVLRHLAMFRKGQDPSLMLMTQARPSESDKERARREVVHCSGLDAVQLSGQVGLLRQAARAGNLAAIEAYVGGGALSQNLHAGSFHLDDYRQEALPLAEAAVRAGSINVLLELKTAFDPEGPLTSLAMVVRSQGDADRRHALDILAALALQRARSDVNGGHDNRAVLEERLARVPEHRRAAFREQAEARFRDWFQGKQRPFDVGGFGYLGRRADGRDVNDLCTNGYVDDPLQRQPIGGPP